jgi:hypothetical protein
MFKKKGKKMINNIENIETDLSHLNHSELDLNTLNNNSETIAENAVNEIIQTLDVENINENSTVVSLNNQEIAEVIPLTNLMKKAKKVEKIPKQYPRYFYASALGLALGSTLAPLSVNNTTPDLLTAQLGGFSNPVLNSIYTGLTGMNIIFFNGTGIVEAVEKFTATSGKFKKTSSQMKAFVVQIIAVIILTYISSMQVGRQIKNFHSDENDMFIHIKVALNAIANVFFYYNCTNVLCEWYETIKEMFSKIKLEFGRRKLNNKNRESILQKIKSNHTSESISTIMGITVTTPIAITMFISSLLFSIGSQGSTTTPQKEASLAILIAQFPIISNVMYKGVKMPVKSILDLCKNRRSNAIDIIDTDEQSNILSALRFIVSHKKKISSGLIGAISAFACASCLDTNGFLGFTQPNVTAIEGANSTDMSSYQLANSRALGCWFTTALIILTGIFFPPTYTAFCQFFEAITKNEITNDPETNEAVSAADNNTAITNDPETNEAVSAADNNTAITNDPETNEAVSTANNNTAITNDPEQFQAVTFTDPENNSSIAHINKNGVSSITLGPSPLNEIIHATTEQADEISSASTSQSDAINDIASDAINIIYKDKSKRTIIPPEGVIVRF